MGVKKGSKGNNQKTGIPKVDKKRFSHLATQKQTDNRCTPFAKMPKDKIIKAFLLGDHDEYTSDEVYAAARFTTKEKMLIMEDPLFRDLWCARGLDVMFNLIVPTREQEAQYRLIGQRLEYYSQTTRGTKFTVPEGTKIELTVGKDTPSTIDVTPESSGE